MTKLFNRFGEKRLRRTLRNEMPRAEVILWSRLKGKQINGVKFRRQYSIDKYILDFYAPELKLGIELDGDSHFGDGAEQRDAIRQSIIEACGIRLLRFNNVDVFENIDAIVDSIGQTIASNTPDSNDSPPSDPPESPLVKGGLSDSDLPQPLLATASLRLGKEGLSA